MFAKKDPTSAAWGDVHKQAIEDIPTGRAKRPCTGVAPPMGTSRRMIRRCLDPSKDGRPESFQHGQKTCRRPRRTRIVGALPRPSCRFFEPTIGGRYGPSAHLDLGYGPPSREPPPRRTGPPAPYSGRLHAYVCAHLRRKGRELSGRDGNENLIHPVTVRVFGGTRAVC